MSRARACRRLLLFFLVAVASSGATVFRWVDPGGITHYSDRPQPGAQALELKLGVPYYYVERVYDGDTLFLKDGMRVRLLGINAPELESRYRAEEAGGSAARDWLREQIEGQKARLEFDQERHDHYGRWLAYVFTVEGEHLNLRLVEEGLAAVNIIPPNLKYSRALMQAQEQAEAAKQGLWDMPDYAPQPIETLTQGDYRRGWQRYQGIPVKIQEGRKYLRLFFSKSIDVRIPQEYLPLFGEPERYLAQRIEVRGWVSRRGKHYSILVRHPSALKLLAY
jgi:micrococcal nuclease